MNAKVIFSKEFLDKTKGEELTAFQKGKIYFDRLTDLDNNGELSKAHNRSEVVKLVGYTGSEGNGYSWVSNLVRRGHLTETLAGVEDGNKYYEYHLARKRPTYGKRRRSKKPMTVEDRAAQLQKLHNEAMKHCVTKEEKPQLVIRYGKVEITVGDNAGVEYIVKLVKELNKEA